MTDIHSAKNNPRNTGKKTTGKFKTRGELIEKLLFLTQDRKMSLSSAARCCGISRSAGQKIQMSENNVAQI